MPDGKPYWAAPRYVDDGDTVSLPVEHLPNGKTKVVRCVVACAAGTTCRIVNAEKAIDKWVRLEDLLVSPNDPRHWDQHDVR